MKIETQYSKPVKVTIKHHAWLMDQYRKQDFKSAAAFLESIIDEFIKPNLFKKKK